MSLLRGYPTIPDKTLWMNEVYLTTASFLCLPRKFVYTLSGSCPFRAPPSRALLLPLSARPFVGVFVYAFLSVLVDLATLLFPSLTYHRE